MLHENNKNKCLTKAIILVILLIFLINIPFLLVIFIFLLFVTPLNIEKTLQLFGIADCFPKKEKQIWHEYKTKKYSENNHDSFLGRIEEQLEWVVFGEKKDSDNFKESYRQNYSIPKDQEEFTINEQVAKRYFPSQIREKSKTQQKNQTQTKSIWDDYESVIDIMNKRK